MEKKMATTASMFGAALTSMLIAPDLQADIVPITFTPGSILYNGVPPTTLVAVHMNPISTGFSQWNDYVGRTMLAGGLAGISIVSSSQTLSSGNFNPGSVIAFTPGSSGKVFVGFKTVGGNVGWFSYTAFGPQGAVVYGPGQYGSMGEAVHVPAPGALALLALGAVGVRRSRKRAAA